MNRHFFREDTQIVNRYMKRCSTPLIIRGLQIKTRLIPPDVCKIVIVIVRKIRDHKCRSGFSNQKKTAIVDYQCECNLIQLVRKTLQNTGFKIKNIIT